MSGIPRNIGPTYRPEFKPTNQLHQSQLTGRVQKAAQQVVIPQTQSQPTFSPQRTPPPRPRRVVSLTRLTPPPAITAPAGAPQAKNTAPLPPRPGKEAYENSLQKSREIANQTSVEEKPAPQQPSKPASPPPVPPRTDLFKKGPAPAPALTPPAGAPQANNTAHLPPRAGKAAYENSLRQSREIANQTPVEEKPAPQQPTKPASPPPVPPRTDLFKSEPAPAPKLTAPEQPAFLKKDPPIAPSRVQVSKPLPSLPNEANVNSSAPRRPLPSPPPVAQLTKNQVSPRFLTIKNELDTTEKSFSRSLEVANILFPVIENSDAKEDFKELNRTMNNDFSTLKTQSEALQQMLKDATTESQINAVYKSPEFNTYMESISKITQSYATYIDKLGIFLKTHDELNTRIIQAMTLKLNKHRDEDLRELDASDPEAAKNMRKQPAPLASDVTSYLVTPIQRGPRHELLIKELIREGTDNSPLNNSLNLVKAQLDATNAKMRLALAPTSTPTPTSTSILTKIGRLFKRSVK